MNFEEYPNDVSRGFNIPHVPVFYEMNDGKKDFVFSDSMLVMTPEPDFSMPFNVMAVTNMLLGTLFVNTVFAIIKDEDSNKDEEEQKKTEDQSKKVEDSNKEKND